MSGRHLTIVTITGADDRVSPMRLAALSAEFPFVEWGILRSAKRAGTSRYPSDEWVVLFNSVVLDAYAKTRRWTASSHHLCGRFARDAMAGNLSCDVPTTSRVQLNGFSNFARDPSNVLDLRWAREFEDVIVQCNELQVLQFASTVPSPCDTRMHVSALYDASGGRGIEQPSWPDPGFGGVGFAGGIGPRNASEVAIELTRRGRPFWIDMESGVRTDDRFDLGKIRAVLEAVRPLVHGGAA